VCDARMRCRNTKEYLPNLVVSGDRCRYEWNLHSLNCHFGRVKKPVEYPQLASSEADADQFYHLHC
jgi:hypothetical protein